MDELIDYDVKLDMVLGLATGIVKSDKEKKTQKYS